MAQIKVNKHYIGLDSNNQMIYPGTYEVGDPLLYGRENDLIEIGYAEPLPVEFVQAIDPAAAYKPLSPTELKGLAESRGVDLGGATKKADIIMVLVAADTAAGSGE